MDKQRKRGKWISHEEHCRRLKLMPSGLGIYWWCSECEYGLPNNMLRESKFCPNCGADMMEGKE